MFSVGIELHVVVSTSDGTSAALLQMHFGCIVMLCLSVQAHYVCLAANISWSNQLHAA